MLPPERYRRSRVSHEDTSARYYITGQGDNMTDRSGQPATPLRGTTAGAATVRLAHRWPGGLRPHVGRCLDRADGPEIGGKVPVRQVGIQHEAATLLRK